MCETCKETAGHIRQLTGRIVEEEDTAYHIGKMFDFAQHEATDKPEVQGWLDCLVRYVFK